MRHIILVFYILFFATGFTGAAALLYLKLKARSSIAGLLLAFQLVFLAGLGIVAFYYYLGSIQGFPGPTGEASSVVSARTALSVAATLSNVAIYFIAILLIRRLRPRRNRPGRISLAAEILSGLVILKSLASAALALAGGGASVILASDEWSIAGYILVGLAMGAFGFLIRRCELPGEHPSVVRLLRIYAVCVLVYAPMGLVEYALNSAGLRYLEPLSLDFIFYLAWNVVSISAFMRSIQPGGQEKALTEEISPEAVATFGLTPREREMVILIARGLANKEIAAELDISPATVRTHIYNLFRKVGVSGRIDLLNKLKG